MWHFFHSKIFVFVSTLALGISSATLSLEASDTLSCNALLSKVIQVLPYSPEFTKKGIEYLRAIQTKVEHAKEDTQRLLALYQNPATRNFPALAEDLEVIIKILKEVDEYEKYAKESPGDAEASKAIITNLLEDIRTRAKAVRDTIAKSQANQANEIVLELGVSSGKTSPDQEYYANKVLAMYLRYIERNPQWKVEIVESEGSSEGIKHATLHISGAGVGRAFENEGGIHRLEHHSLTRNNGAVYTTKVKVAVLPVTPQSEFEFKDSDFEILSARPQGPGGQNVNKNETAVRVIYKPTGDTITIQNYRSQKANRNAALQILRARLQARESEKRHAERNELKRTQVGISNEQSRIRTYDLIEGKVRDERTHQTFSSESTLARGDLQMMIEGVEDAVLVDKLNDAINDMHSRPQASTSNGK